MYLQKIRNNILYAPVSGAAVARRGYAVACPPPLSFWPANGVRPGRRGATVLRATSPTNETRPVSHVPKMNFVRFYAHFFLLLLNAVFLFFSQNRILSSMTPSRRRAHIDLRRTKHKHSHTHINTHKTRHTHTRFGPSGVYALAHRKQVKAEDVQTDTSFVRPARHCYVTTTNSAIQSVPGATGCNGGGDVSSAVSSRTRSHGHYRRAQLTVTR